MPITGQYNCQRSLRTDSLQWREDRGVGFCCIALQQQRPLRCPLMTAIIHNAEQCWWMSMWGKGRGRQCWYWHQNSVAQGPPEAKPKGILCRDGILEMFSTRFIFFRHKATTGSRKDVYPSTQRVNDNHLVTMQISDENPCVPTFTWLPFDTHTNNVTDQVQPLPAGSGPEGYRALLVWSWFNLRTF